MMEWLTSINNFVWGPCMLVLLFGTGLYLTVGLRFFTFGDVDIEVNADETANVIAL